MEYKQYKNATKVELKRREIIKTISEYTCPRCHIHIEGAGIGKFVTRFRCINCNNELIVIEHLEPEEK